MKDTRCFLAYTLANSDRQINTLPARQVTGVVNSEREYARLRYEAMSRMIEALKEMQLLDSKKMEELGEASTLVNVNK